MLAGRKEGASFGTQFLYAVITVGVLQLVLGLDDMLSATIAVIISATLYLGLMPIAHLRLRNHPARSTPKGNPCVAPFTELGQTLKLAFTKYPECAKYIALVVCCENGGGAVGIGLLTIYAQNVLGFGFLETGIISLLLLLLGAPLCVIFPKITARLGPKKSWALILVMFVVPGVVIPAAFSEPGFGAFIGVLVVYGVVGAMQLAWYITYLQVTGPPPPSPPHLPPPPGPPGPGPGACSSALSYPPAARDPGPAASTTGPHTHFYPLEDEDLGDSRGLSPGAICRCVRVRVRVMG